MHGDGQRIETVQKLLCRGNIKECGERFTDHLRKYEAKLGKSVFWLHCRDDHNGVIQRLEVSIVCKRSSDTILRQVSKLSSSRRMTPILTNVASGAMGMSLGDEKKIRESPINTAQKSLYSTIKIITRSDEGTVASCRNCSRLLE